MEPAELGLLAELDEIAFVDPAFPVVANATSEAISEAAGARRCLGMQLTAPVRWVASMQRMAQIAGEGVTFVEIGPGSVLSGLLRRIVPGSQGIPLGTAEQINTFLEQKA
jgi:[acyl-carrier-protein] S-malonyltransferase